MASNEFAQYFAQLRRFPGSAVDGYQGEDDSDSEEEIESRVVAKDFLRIRELVNQACSCVPAFRDYFAAFRTGLRLQSESDESLVFYANAQLLPANPRDVADAIPLWYLPAACPHLLPLATSVFTPEFVCLWVQPNTPNCGVVCVLTVQDGSWTVRKLHESLPLFLQRVVSVLEAKRAAWLSTDFLASSPEILAAGAS
eukprot:TRINITY_DN14182_c0_g1_i1.p1 TRINITY_DN14182_c0_g1~~TRINITY_DN14182_c0_g1_i1.p1  ORF type:complete len:198 (+),score=22.76 TRINITY_DN14182_c0_g1_i1:49-642(+)